MFIITIVNIASYINKNIKHETQFFICKNFILKIVNFALYINKEMKHNTNTIFNL